MCVDCGNRGVVPFDYVGMVADEWEKRHPNPSELDALNLMEMIGPPRNHVTICLCRAGSYPRPCWWKDGVCVERPSDV